MNSKLREEMAEQVKKLERSNLSQDSKLYALYAWVEQNVHNNLVRDYNRDYRCPICGAEKS